MKKEAHIIHINFYFFADKSDYQRGRISDYRSYKKSIFDAMQDFLSIKKPFKIEEEIEICFADGSSDFFPTEVKQSVHGNFHFVAFEKLISANQILPYFFTFESCVNN